MDCETRRSCGEAELFIVGSEDQIIDLVADEQRAREMDGVKGADEGRERLRRSRWFDRSVA